MTTPPLDEAARALTDICEMIENCADVPRNPDSLPMMVLARAKSGLAYLETVVPVEIREIREPAAPEKASVA